MIMMQNRVRYIVFDEMQQKQFDTTSYKVAELENAA